MKNFDISICVLCYEQSFDKIRQTLKSILYQTNLSFEIVVSDDGSKTNHFEKIKDFFYENHFSDFQLVANEINKGTVLNALAAVNKSRGEYIKLIGPGDMIYGDVLRKWLDYLKEENAKISFSDTVYYYSKDDRIELFSQKAYPQNLYAYKKGGNILKNDMLLNTDLCVGSSVIVDKNTMLRYLSKIKNKVKYLEDCMYVLMIYDNVQSCFFNYPSILYEFGTGISTCIDGKESPRITKDWFNVFDIYYEVLNEKRMNLFDKKFLLVVRYRDSRIKKRIVYKLLRYFLNPNEIIFRFKEKTNFRLRKTPLIYKEEFINYIAN